MTNFRSLSPAAPPQTSGTPQTGLGILMNNKSSASPNSTLSTGYQMATMTLEQQQMVQADLADRDRQASALAAAGMVAETVGYNQHVGNGIAPPPNGLGLHAPPMLGSVVLPATPEPTGTIDGINWSMMDVGMALDDMEMDFANLFDPAHEEANMQMEGSGWPGTNDQVPSPMGDIANTGS